MYKINMFLYRKEKNMSAETFMYVETFNEKQDKWINITNCSLDYSFEGIKQNPTLILTSSRDLRKDLKSLGINCKNRPKDLSRDYGNINGVRQEYLKLSNRIRGNTVFPAGIPFFECNVEDFFQRIASKLKSDSLDSIQAYIANSIQFGYSHQLIDAGSVIRNKSRLIFVSEF